jgi:hypothetical protein
MGIGPMSCSEDTAVASIEIGVPKPAVAANPGRVWLVDAVVLAAAFAGAVLSSAVTVLLYLS